MKAYLFPGQGSQKKGMGQALFAQFPEPVQQADAILGYSIAELCLENPDNKLNLTQYTQPALFVVNALTYLQTVAEGARPDFVAGHSLGEYNALFAAGVVDFATGLRLVQKRGELMSQAAHGGMAAVVGLSLEQVEAVLQQQGFSEITIANFNAPTQLVLSGDKTALNRAQSFFVEQGARYLLLNVSAAFHSPFMQPTQAAFQAFLQSFDFAAPTCPVIANVTARPYLATDIKQNLLAQITGSVQWVETIRYLWGQGEMTFVEIGPGNVLTKLTEKIQQETTPLPQDEVKAVKAAPATPAAAVTASQPVGRILPEALGSASFRQDYGLRYAYFAGAMYRGISSKELVIKMGKAGLMGFLGTGGLSLSQIEQDIQLIQQALSAGQAYGMNLLNHLNDPQLEEKTVDLYLQYGIRQVEASAYMQNLSAALIRYRLTGLRRDVTGKIEMAHKIIAKVSRPEVAQAFLSPAPERMVEKLRAAHLITAEQAELAQYVPVASDICVEADSGGHTDQGVAYVLMPAMLMLRDRLVQQYQYQCPVRVGAAGGIGTPEAASAAFILGADFIVTGSINQCTVEAGTSAAVKDLLQQMNVQDTDYAPAGDMFEIGAKVQVLKKGLFFAARAKRLYDLYQQYNSLEALDPKTQQQLQEKYFRRSFAEIYAETKRYFAAHCPAEIDKAERNPKHKMALVFRWYFAYATELAMSGNPQQKVDYQVHTGPALGAFNQWVKGTELEDWRNRHVDEIALKLLAATADLLNQRCRALQGAR